MIILTIFVIEGHDELQYSHAYWNIVDNHYLNHVIQIAPASENFDRLHEAWKYNHRERRQKKSK